MDVYTDFGAYKKKKIIKFYKKKKIKRKKTFIDLIHQILKKKF